MQRANYLQFHKGTYFDSTITAISSWPAGALKKLSIVQDPIVDHTPFAQPLVFFNLRPLAELSCAEAVEGVTSLRLRIPGRSVVPFISIASDRFPSLCSLDLSTGAIGSEELAQILMKYPCLMYLRLDACNINTTREEIPDMGESIFATIGRMCAISAHRRSRDREKELKAYREALQLVGNEQGGQRQGRPRAKAGRKGLATATVSLRGANEFVISEDQSAQGASTSTSAEELLSLEKLRVAPIPPLLQALCITLKQPPASLQPLNVTGAISASTNLVTQQSQFRQDFERGWDDGIHVLRQIWLRLQASQRNGVPRVVTFKDSMGARDEDGINGASDLIDISDWDDLQKRRWKCPILCLVGEEADNSLHVQDCGHEATKDSWID